MESRFGFSVKFSFESYRSHSKSPRMLKYILVVLFLIAVMEMVSADFSCYFSDSICKSITCRNCKVATCVTGDCVCTLC
ncbi:unnamed protein product [Caenorhabditis sp. 36 PRJEB53466]|nr:unnamed protein product [Caenorhabditis sp. 36 PRJEB53466]